jgi:hypothetical protein
MKRQSKRTRQKTTKRPSTRAKSGFIEPRTLEEFFAMSERDQEFWGNVGQMVTEIRAGASRRQAARKFGLDPRTVQPLARSAMRKLRNGRWAARTHDRLLRVLVIPTRTGLREIGVRDSRQASLLGKYWTAVERYRDSGDASAPEDFADGTSSTQAENEFGWKRICGSWTASVPPAFFRSNLFMRGLPDDDQITRLRSRSRVRAQGHCPAARRPERQVRLR